MIDVTNDGPTIAAEDLPRLFDRFHRVGAARERSTEGAGVGLSITETIVDAHRGAITAWSEAGLTRFRIRLPHAGVGSSIATGIGVRAHVDGHAIALGNTRLIEEAGADVRPMAADAETLRADGASVIYVAVDGQLAGLLAVHDPVKDSTPEAIKILQAAGVRVVMATGDGTTTDKQGRFRTRPFTICTRISDLRWSTTPST